MHPKVMKAVDRFRYKMCKVEKLEPLFLHFEKKKYNFKLNISVDIWGDPSFSTIFDKRSDLDPFLIDLADFYGRTDLPKLSLYSNRLNANFNDATIEAIPNEGSDCELVEVGEEFIPGKIVKKYKMKCEKLHEEAMVEAGDVF